MKEDITKKTLKEEYETMKFQRQPYLDKAKIAASYTIPSLIVEEGINLKNIPTPNQSVGADGINNLSSKVTMTMLPPNQTFFKFSIDNPITFNDEDSEYTKREINKGLSKIEKMLSDYQEQLGDRVCLGEAQKHLYVAGNVFLVHDPKNGLKYYPLNRFCVKRDYCGNVLKAITEESVGFYALPKEVQESILHTSSDKNIQELEEKELTLYTGFKRKENHWEIYQECEGVEIPNSKGTYPIDICPFMALRYVRIDGESYGRGLIEEYIGDLSYLDVLSLAIKQASLAGSKLVMLVNPNGLTKIKHLSEAKNGGFALGRVEDVQPLQANKYYDLKVAQAECDKIERRLNRIFVMRAAIQRNAERVTAEEIRTMVQDLEEALGNHYSIMCKEFQLAYVKLTYFHLKKEKKNLIPDLMRDKNVKLTLTTGLEALGRSSDLNKLVMFLDIMGKIAPAIQHLGGKVEKISQDVALSLNLDIDGMFYTEEEKAQQASEAQKLALLSKVAPNAINKYGDMLINNENKEK
ncbi:phage tail protein [bacterium]|nr:phage tail protein [bacterium]